MVYKIVSHKLWDIIWLVVGLCLVVLSTVYNITSTDFSSANTMTYVLTVTSFVGSVLGMITVNLFANRRGKYAAVLAIIGAALDAFNNYSYGVMGTALVSLYCLALDIKAVATLGKEIKVTRTNKNNLLVSSIVAVAGVVVLTFFGKSVMPEEAPLWVMALNVIAFLIPIVAQYLMLEGKALSWIFWACNNFVNIILFTYTVLCTENKTAIIYLAMVIMYQINSIKAIILWYAEQPKN